MKNRKREMLSWSTKLWTMPGLADDIAELLREHEENCISRMAAEYWLEKAGWAERDFLRAWLGGAFDD